MKSTPKQPGNQSSRPSLYKPDSTSSFSVLDAATVQGGQKRTKTPAAKEKTATRLWPWAVAIVVAILASLIVVVLLFSSHEAEAPVITHAPVSAPATAKVPEAPAVPLSETPALSPEIGKPALVEQLEMPQQESPTTGADPMAILNADHSQPNAPQVAGTPPVAKSASAPPASAKPNIAKPKAAGKPREMPMEDPTKAQRDVDVDFMEAVLSRMPKPAPRNEPKPEPKADAKPDHKAEPKPEAPHEPKQPEAQ
ncbi:hypothetical protein ACUHMQ_07730 [Chitinimonas sp. PSY-7]|uniref:hypothetical protein n=1 Tax=Chitinimonas sp. PSY-7 TaxID=3459088 RepID=UPI0040402AFE